MLREAGYFLRMMRGCHEFARAPRPADPAEIVRQALELREENFLELVRLTIFANPANPFHALLRWADCGYAELSELVRSQGLDAALEELRRAGVYLKHDELKGRTPILRDGRELAVQTSDFVNPLVSGALETTSSGSRSSGTITRPSLEFQLHREAQEALIYQQFELGTRAIAALYPLLPSTVGIRRAISAARLGRPFERWFAIPGAARDSLHYQLLTKAMAQEVRLLGLSVPQPEFLPHNDFLPAARWIAERKSEGREVLFLAPVSMAVRTAEAARETGLDIRGTLFMSGAEPLTSAKRATIERTGAEVFPRYGISELGWVGCSCRQMTTGSRVHVMMDSVAVISHRRRPPFGDVDVDSLLITTVLPSSAYVLINVEMDDSGTLGQADCGCPLQQMGFTQQLDDIFSFGKLTGQGVTLVGSSIVELIETTLPARFGGVATDYQLVERDEGSQTVTELRVNPRLGPLSEEEIKTYFLGELKKTWGGSLTYRQWTSTGGLRVALEEPIVSGDRKIHTLHLLRDYKS